MMPVILAVLVVLFLAVVSFMYQGAWFVIGNQPQEQTELRRSALRQEIADCREGVLDARAELTPEKAARLRQVCDALESDYRRRFGEAP